MALCFFFYYYYLFIQKKESQHLTSLSTSSLFTYDLPFSFAFKLNSLCLLLFHRHMILQVGGFVDFSPLKNVSDTLCVTQFSSVLYMTLYTTKNILDSEQESTLFAIFLDFCASTIHE